MFDMARWLDYKRRFLLPEGRIVDTGNKGVSHSEGQGYGMVLAVAANDGAAFETMARWTRDTLLRKDVALHSWRFVPGEANPVADPNNATDGDLLIAWALLLAGRRWGKADYLRRSAAIRAAVEQRLILKRHGFTLLLPGLEGFVKNDRVVVNPSYYVWPAIDAFARLEPQIWTPLSADGLAMLKAARFGPAALPADWLDIKGEKIVEPAEGRDPLFGFEGIRIPLYCLMSGRRAQCDAIARYWSALGRAGKPLPAWVNVVTNETAPYPLSYGGSVIAAWLLGQPQPANSGDNDYYSATLAMMGSIRI